MGRSLVIGTSGTSAPLPASVEFIREYSAPANHGALGRDAAGDETAELQAWAASANPDKVIEQEYEISDELVFASGASVVGAGKLLSTDATGTNSAVSCSGTPTLIGTVTATRGAFTATVALDSGQTLAEGEWLAIRNATDGSWAGVAWPAGRSYYRAGEPIRVAHVVDATSIITTTAIRDSYTAVELYRANPARFVWDGPEIETAGACALSLDTVLFAEVRGRFFGGERAALSLRQLIGGVIERSTADCRATATDTQYGLLGSGLHGTRIVGCNLYGRRHGSALGGSGWINRDVVFDGCRIGSDGVVGWASADTHGNCENTTYRDCAIGGGMIAGGRGVTVTGGSIGGDYGCVQFNETVGGRVSVSGTTLNANGAFAGGIVRGATTATNFQYLVEPLHICLDDSVIDIRSHTEESLMTLYQRGHTVPVDVRINGNTFRGVNASLSRLFRTTLFSGSPLSRRIEIQGNVLEDTGGALVSGDIARLDGGYADLGPSVISIQGDPANLLSGTTAQRPASPAAWTRYVDETLGKMILWNGSAWTNVDGSALA